VTRLPVYLGTSKLCDHIGTAWELRTLSRGRLNLLSIRFDAAIALDSAVILALVLDDQGRCEQAEEMCR
jgi:hypothetical protein